MIPRAINTLTDILPILTNDLMYSPFCRIKVSNMSDGFSSGILFIIFSSVLTAFLPIDFETFSLNPIILDTKSCISVKSLFFDKQVLSKSKRNAFFLYSLSNYSKKNYNS